MNGFEKSGAITVIKTDKIEQQHHILQLICHFDFLHNRVFTYKDLFTPCQSRICFEKMKSKIMLYIFFILLFCHTQKKSKKKHLEKLKLKTFKLKKKFTQTINVSTHRSSHHLLNEKLKKKFNLKIRRR